ncbi:MAG TPA: DMT family transporter [Armatimonadota bacterium]|nr:DMT family transporter [Armatimonadota bacterium]
MTIENPPKGSWVLGYLAAVGSSVCVGLLFVIQKHALNHFDPVSLNWLQMIAVLVLSAVTVVVVPAERRFPGPRVIPWLVLFGCFGSVVFGMRNVGIDLTSATTGSVVVRTEVAMVMLLSFVVLKVKPDVFGWIGAAMLFVGAYLSLDIKPGSLNFTPWGTVALLASAAAIAINALIIKTKFGGVSNSLTVGANSLVQTVVFGVITCLTGAWPTVVAAFADPGLVIVVGLGALCIFGGLYLYYLSMKLIPMWIARAINLLIPPITALADWIWLGSTPTGGQILGLVTVTVGAGMVIPCLVKGAQPKASADASR